MTMHGQTFRYQNVTIFVHKMIGQEGSKFDFKNAYILLCTSHKRPKCKKCTFLNGSTPASFSFIFGLFKQTFQFLQQYM